MHRPSKYAVRVFSSTCFASRAAGLFGFDTGSIGAITEMSTFEAEFGVLSPFIRGLTVSVILLPSALSGMLAGNVSDKISRKKSISLGAAIFAAGSALSAGAKGSLVMLIVARCSAGTGEGLFLGCLGVYLTETSSRHMRSHMLLINQLMTSGAIAGRRDEALAVLDRLVDPKGIEERRELLAIPPAAVRSRSQIAALKDIWAPGVRGRTTLGAILQVFQQLSGIDFVLFYAPLLFQQAGLDPSTSSFMASGCTGLVLVACVFAGTFYIEKVGRRKIWMVGGTGTSVCLFTLGFLYAAGAAHTPVGKYAAIIFIELFAVYFTSSWSLITKLYAAEIQPMRTRAAATSTGQAVNQAVNFVVAISGPAFLARSSSGPYFFYGG
ncbi:hypothetical protein JCM10296v2_004050 [Rhodotorula toruloides]